MYPLHGQKMRRAIIKSIREVADVLNLLQLAGGSIGTNKETLPSNSTLTQKKKKILVHMYLDICTRMFTQRSKKF